MVTRLSSTRLVLDALGTDRRPVPELEAAVRLARASDELALELVGERSTLERGLAELGWSDPDAAGLEIVHASDQIAMGEAPARAVRSKPDASLCVAFDRLAAGEVSGLVSAGNSGAILAASLLRLGRLAGVDRPAIVTTFPWSQGADSRTGAGGRTVLLDVGANVQCRVLNLAQFAVIGAAFSRVEIGVPLPRVAVLANGSERRKGTTLTREAHDLLEAGQASGRTLGFEFVGYVEPDALFSGACDVAVTDGWTGNIALKLAEGAMAAWPRMLRGALVDRHGDQGAAAITAAIEVALQEVELRVDPDAHGGAPLLGVDGVVIICHGSAGPRAIYNALLEAKRFAERDLPGAVARAVSEHGELFEIARTLR